MTDTAASLCSLLLFLSSSCFCLNMDSSSEQAPQADSSLIVFQLFTRKNPYNRQTLALNDLQSLQQSNYNTSWPTKIYGVGWNNDGTIANSTRDAYLMHGDYNFIFVDWQAIQEGNNLFVFRTTIQAGQYTALFVDFLVENGTPMRLIHLMGHSAGAQLVGIAGEFVTSGKLPRITGLDPAASSNWNVDTTDGGLDRTDAEFVDIIHTNGGTIAEGCVAIWDAIGHIDFYVNGGKKQPGCGDPEFSCCSHCRAVDLFAESINTDVGFRSLLCDSYVDYTSGNCTDNPVQYMGEHVPSDARGVYYVNTNGEEPWAMG